jgi:hypothetical protein
VTDVWVFMGDGARNPSAVFSSLAKAQIWIEVHKLSGLLTEYPVDIPVLDWAVAEGYFTPKSAEDWSTYRRETFTSGAQHHLHFVNGCAG